MELLGRVQPRGFKFQINVPQRNIEWYQSGYEFFSSIIFKQLAKSSDVVIDIGSHVGYFSHVAAEANPNLEIYAVEASPENAKTVRINSEQNGFQVKVINAAFSDKPGKRRVQLTEASDNCSFSGHPDSPTIDTLEVDAITGADLGIGNGKTLLIKIDVEGYEPEVLTGLEPLMKHSKDSRILIELNPECLIAAGNNPYDLLNWFWNRDYRIFILNESQLDWEELRNDKSFDYRNMPTKYSNLLCLKNKSCATLSIVMHSSALSGAELCTVELVEDLVSSGILVKTIIPSPDQKLGDLLKFSGSGVVQVEEYPWWAQIVPKLFPKFNSPQFWFHYSSAKVIEAAKLNDTDLILTQTLAIPQGAIAAATLGKPHIWWIHEYGDLDHKLHLPSNPAELGSIIRSLSEFVVTVTRDVKKHFFENDSDSSVFVINPQPKFSFEKNLTVKAGEIWTMGLIGTLNESKGHADAIRAVGLLRRKGIKVFIKAFGYGSNEDLQRLNKIAEEENVSDLFEYLGQNPDRNEIYSQINCVAVTSKLEAFGRVAFEAIQAEIPVIYANTGGPSEYMVDGQTGLAYEPGDVKSLSEAIIKLNSDSKYSQTLAMAAKSVMKKRTEASSPGSELSELIHRALTNYKASDYQQFVGSVGQISLDFGKKQDQIEKLAKSKEEFSQEIENLSNEVNSLKSQLERIFNGRTWRYSKSIRKILGYSRKFLN